MVKAVRKGKQNRHEKITVVLMSGNPVTVDELKSMFTGKELIEIEKRLPQNICAIKCDGGVIRVTKDGRRVTSYQLMNPQEFNAEGRYTGPVAKPAPIAAPAVAKVQTEVVEQELVEA